jgi:hypothetical protein
MGTVPEVWKAIPDHPGYEASGSGKIKSCDRVIARRGPDGMTREYNWKGRILAPTLHRGYLIASLGKDKKVWGVHQWMALTWIGPANGLTVNHINGIKTDNRIENLEYVTNSENVYHAYRTGLLSNHGTTNGNAKLTADQVREVRQRFQSGLATAKQLAEEYGIARTNMSGIVHGRKYKDVI